jgi:fimbrial chaperone protein
MTKSSLRIFTFLLLIPSFSWAFRFSPMVLEFSPTGAGSTQVLVVENPGDEKLPIQIESFARSTNAKGEEVRTKTEDLTIYPEQVVLLPKEKRNVRVMWAGEIKEGREKAYRIVASQLPVDFREKNSAPKKPSVNLKFLLQYVASAYVVPEGATPKVVVKEVKKSGPQKIHLTFTNEGKAHKVLSFKNLKITAGSQIVLETQTNKAIESLNLLPGDSGTVEIETPKTIPEGVLKADLVLKDEN